MTAEVIMFPLIAPKAEEPPVSVSIPANLYRELLWLAASRPTPIAPDECIVAALWTVVHTIKQQEAGEIPFTA